MSNKECRRKKEGGVPGGAPITGSEIHLGTPRLAPGTRIADLFSADALAGKLPVAHPMRTSN